VLFGVFGTPRQGPVDEWLGDLRSLRDLTRSTIRAYPEAVGRTAPPPPTHLTDGPPCARNVSARIRCRSRASGTPQRTSSLAITIPAGSCMDTIRPAPVDHFAERAPDVGSSNGLTPSRHQAGSLPLVTRRPPCEYPGRLCTIPRGVTNVLSQMPVFRPGEPRTSEGNICETSRQPADDLADCQPILYPVCNLRLLAE
jgi:hypothetical protein